MSKADSGLTVIGNPLMICILLAIIYRDGMGFSRLWPQEVDDCISHILSCLALDLYQESQAGHPLRQGYNGLNFNVDSNHCIPQKSLIGLTEITPEGVFTECFEE